MEPKLHPDAIRTALSGTSSEGGDRADFARITTENHEALFKHIYHRLHDYHLTCDILQETFRAAWEKRHTRNADRPPLPWLKQIALNKISDHFKAKTAKKRGGGNDEVTVVVLQPNGEPQSDVKADACVAPGLESWQEASTNELHSALALAIKSLAERDQEILRQRYCESVPVADIASFFGLRGTATSAILRRSRQQIELTLKEMGFVDMSSELNRYLKGDTM